MVGCPQSQKLLQQVWWRLFAVRVASRAFWAFVVLASLYGVLLMLSRLTGLIPDVFQPWTLALPAGFALLFALFWPSRLTRMDAARSVDRAHETRDLFLTLTLLDSAAGAYQPLVARDAERAAQKVNPPRVVPFSWQRRALTAGLTTAALALGIGFLPTLDPFGKVAEANQVATKQRQLVESKKSTELRKAQLKQQDLEKENSAEVEQALEKLKADLRSMRKDQPKLNQEKLAIDQKILGDKFRATNEAIKTLMNQAGVDQKFGSQNLSEFKKWQEELKSGSSESMAKEVEELKKDLEQLAKMEDPVARTEMERKIEKRLKAMADFAGEKTGSKSLQAALERAKEQMEAVKSGKPLSSEAMEALQDTMDLAKMELQQLAQSANDLKSLEEALETIASAKQLNKDSQLDGAMTDALTAMDEYKALYEELLAQMGEGEGEGEGEGDGEGDGTGGEGMGRGGDPEEDDDGVKTDFVSEHTKTPIQKGKILLSMKQRGMSESGDANREFQAMLNDVKQGFAEAIEAEQIPPGYHDGIKSYFDSLGNQPAAAAEQP